jgi:hypothetical protein
MLEFSTFVENSQGLQYQTLHEFAQLSTGVLIVVASASAAFNNIIK